MKVRSVAASLTVAVAIAACSALGAGSPTRPGAASTELTVFAAASLKGVLDRAKAAYEASHPGITLAISTDSSATLATQIAQGAPADVFLSADRQHPQALVDKGLVDGAPVTFAANELTIIVPSANPAGIASPADLARQGVKVIAAGDEVPITTYATQLVANLASEAGYPADFAASYAANIVSREDNVKAVVAKIELGEGDAGIVYLTDAKASKDVESIDVPDAANVRATYDGVVVGDSKDPVAARAFLDWFAGPDGQAILMDFGFLPPA